MVLKFWKIPREILVFIHVGRLKRLESDASEDSGSNRYTCSRGEGTLQQCFCLGLCIWPPLERCCPSLRLGLLPLVTPVWKHPHRHSQRRVSYVVPDPVRLISKIQHWWWGLSKRGSDGQDQWTGSSQELTVSLAEIREHDFANRCPLRVFLRLQSHTSSLRQVLLYLRGKALV